VYLYVLFVYFCVILVYFCFPFFHFSCVFLAYFVVLFVVLLCIFLFINSEFVDFVVNDSCCLCLFVFFCVYSCVFFALLL